MEYITRLGGHHKCKNSVEAGIKALWIGLGALGNYADAWDLFGPEADNKNEYLSKKDVGNRMITAGGISISEPTVKPWVQTVLLGSNP